MTEGESVRPGPGHIVQLDAADTVSSSSRPAGLTGQGEDWREGDGGQEREEESEHFFKLHNSFAEDSFIFQSYLTSALIYDVNTYLRSILLK